MGGRVYENILSYFFICYCFNGEALVPAVKKQGFFLKA